jgi:hypothetical protein
MRSPAGYGRRLGHSGKRRSLATLQNCVQKHLLSSTKSDIEKYSLFAGWNKQFT